MFLGEISRCFSEKGNYLDMSNKVGFAEFLGGILKMSTCMIFFLINIKHLNLSFYKYVTKVPVPLNRKQSCDCLFIRLLIRLRMQNL